MSEDKPAERPDDKRYSIIVNGRQRQVESEELTFDDLVDLALEDPARGPQIVFTITFRDASGRVTEGMLDEGQRLKVRDGTVINVTRTDQS